MKIRKILVTSMLAVILPCTFERIGGPSGSNIINVASNMFDTSTQTGFARSVMKMAEKEGKGIRTIIMDKKIIVYPSDTLRDVTEKIKYGTL